MGERWGKTDDNFAERESSEETLPSEELAFPYLYFQVQVAFALRMAKVKEISLSEAFESWTGLKARLVEDKNDVSQVHEWEQLLTELVSMSEPQMVDRVFELFKTRPKSKYTPPEYPENDGKHFGHFSFDYYHEKKTIKVHYIVRDRRKGSGLKLKDLELRRAELKEMFVYIQNKYPDAEEVIGGSWIYNLEGYRRIYPPEYTKNMRRLVPFDYPEEGPYFAPTMTFTGNSVWGQFVDNEGKADLDRVLQFNKHLKDAADYLELVDSFPMMTLQPRCHISEFYSFLGIHG